MEDGGGDDGRGDDADVEGLCKSVKGIVSCRIGGFACVQPPTPHLYSAAEDGGF